MVTAPLPPAAYPGHAKVQFGGRLGGRLGGQEDIWTCTVAIQQGGATGFVTGPQEVADQIAPKLETWFHSLAHGMEQRTMLDFVKVNNILPNGHYQDGVTHGHNFTPGITGGAGALAPAFCSLVFTLETGLLRGRAHRGRIYPPNFTYAPLGSHVSLTDVDSALEAAHSLMALLTDNTPTGGFLYQPAVVSRYGPLHYVTAVSVDDIYDVQRRRKNRLAATRHSQATP